MRPVLETRATAKAGLDRPKCERRACRHERRSRHGAPQGCSPHSSISGSRTPLLAPPERGSGSAPVRNERPAARKLTSRSTNIRKPAPTAESGSPIGADTHIRTKRRRPRRVRDRLGAAARLDETEEARSRLSEIGNAEESNADAGEPPARVSWPSRPRGTGQARWQRRGQIDPLPRSFGGLGVKPAPRRLLRSMARAQHSQATSRRSTAYPEAGPGS
jgi:hypothetical protein